MMFISEHTFTSRHQFRNFMNVAAIVNEWLESATLESYDYVAFCNAPDGEPCIGFTDDFGGVYMVPMDDIDGLLKMAEDDMRLITTDEFVHILEDTDYDTDEFTAMYPFYAGDNAGTVLFNLS